MAKQPVTNTITAGYGSDTLINNNFAAIVDAFLNTLSLDGSLPNAMSSDLDMGGNDIINVGTITSTVTNFGFEKDIYTPGVPLSSENIYIYNSSLNFQIPVNFANTRATCVIAPTLPYAISVLKNTTTLGTITFNAGATTGTLATTGTAAERTFVAGDQLILRAPNFIDITINDIAISLLANFSTSQS